MNRNALADRLLNSLPAVTVAVMSLPAIALAQTPVDEQGVPLTPMGAEVESIAGIPAEADALSSAELEDLVGPVALYPDDLLAIVLPASTYPLEIVQAARFLEELAADSSLQPDESWDESITALLNYPEVIQMMDDEIDWTWRLGEAVIAQQNELIAAIEEFRDRAYAAGNLKTDEYQTVSMDDGAIEIEPVDEEIIYVPYYEPTEVVVHQREPVYYYYPRAYPVYYYPYPVGHRFSSGYFWGVTTAYTIGWNSRYLHVRHPSYWGHPYYGSSYYGHYYRRPSISIYNSWYVNNRPYNARYRYRDGDYWRPRTRSGARPHEQRVRNYHYPSNNRDGSAYGENGNRARVTNNGRMDLRLREREGSRRSSTSSTRYSVAATGGTAGRNSTARRNSAEGRDSAVVSSNQRGQAGNRRASNRDSSQSARSSRSANRTRTATDTNANRTANRSATTRRTNDSRSRRDAVVSTRRNNGSTARPTSPSNNRAPSNRATSSTRTERRSNGRRSTAVAPTNAVTPNRAATQNRQTQSNNRSRASVSNRAARAPTPPSRNASSTANRGKSTAVANHSSRSDRSNNRRGKRNN